MKQIFLKAIDKLLENLTSVKVYVLVLSAYFFWHGKLDANDWLIIGGSFITSRVLEYVINKRHNEDKQP